ncbi:hypothetical protein VNO77_23434 [Canavalia gladiata]|uniref:Uncharacterized protein n=1 Tax=Canavalia gladiata TaxID=3824 RepID=A0AAN9L4Y3_CANGL
MRFNKLIRLAFQTLSRRKFHGTTERSSNWRGVIEKELESGIPKENDSVSIYRVPPNMLRVDPKAYTPNNISIGPYHHGAPHLQDMEPLKRKFFHRLFNPNGVNGAKLDEAFKFLEEQEVNVRKCYMGEIKQNSDEFLQMMLIDGSFIIQLLRDLSQNQFRQVPCLNRWMLPTLRRELIMLENQIPLFVLNKLFELTDNYSPKQQSMSVNDLAFRFFYRLLQSDSGKIPECYQVYKYEIQHVLDLLRYNIRRPKVNGEEVSRGTQKQMIHSAKELKESGVKIKADENRELLDISFGRKWGIVTRELTIPSLHISDHRGTVFRNIVAFEKCHKRCNPDVTTYMFFFNRLINSADDVTLLHHKGVLYHSLGNDERVADLINDITKEIAPDMNESYLHKVVNETNKYFDTRYAKTRSSLVRNYLTSWTVGISTLGAILALYFTFIQTICGFVDAFNSLEDEKLSDIFIKALILPFRDIFSVVFDPDGKA